jgi:DNA-binding NarL/FixJ family response regulator
VRPGTRVVLAEDLALLRDGLVRLLDASGFDVVQAVTDGPSLHQALLLHRPDIAVVDVRLPPTFTDEGLRASIAARKRLPGLPILVLSQYVEQVYARELLSDGAGAVGYLLKDRVFDVDDFVAAIRQVADGGTVLDPDVVAQLLTRPANRSPIDRLTPRERDVLALIAQGRSNAAIATALGVSDNAVNFHSTNIFAKLDLPPSTSDNRRVLAMLRFLDTPPAC